MSGFGKTGILVVGHGSRRREANDDVRYVSSRIRERLEAELVEASFLEIESPDLGEGFSRLVMRGATKIIIHPYFLSPGRHTRGDLPERVAAAAILHPNISYSITEPLAANPLVIAASLARIRETMRTDESKVHSHARRGAGKVFLVGAGPGDPGLLTLRAAELLGSADSVIYDRLVNPKILDLASSHAELIYVGKICGGKRTPQKEINRLLIEHSRRGERVLRLKGGDPFIFGRGGEEAEALWMAGIEFEIVPGISSAVAVPAYAGIPLTHRGIAASVAILTGREAAGSEANALAAGRRSFAADTLVILMGVTRMEGIICGLISSGRSPGTPAAVVTWGTYEEQHVVTGDLGSLAERARKEGVRPPGVIVVGDVVRLREKLAWFRPERTRVRDRAESLDCRL